MIPKSGNRFSDKIMREQESVRGNLAARFQEFRDSIKRDHLSGC